MFISLFPSSSLDQAPGPPIWHHWCKLVWKWEFYVGGIWLNCVIPWQVSVNTENDAILWIAIEIWHMTSLVDWPQWSSSWKVLGSSKRWQADSVNICIYGPCDSNLLFSIWESKIKVICMQLFKDIVTLMKKRYGK